MIELLASLIGLVGLVTVARRMATKAETGRPRPEAALSRPVSLPRGRV